MKRLFRKNFIILNFNPPYWEEQSHIKKRRGYWEEQSRKKKNKGRSYWEEQSHNTREEVIGKTVPQKKRRGYWEEQS